MLAKLIVVSVGAQLIVVTAAAAAIGGGETAHFLNNRFRRRKAHFWIALAELYHISKVLVFSFARRTVGDVISGGVAAALWGRV